MKEIALDSRDDIFDVNIEVSFDRRAYRGKSKKDNMKFRLVALYNDDSEENHYYITNIPPDILDATEIGAIYAGRWEIELIYTKIES